MNDVATCPDCGGELYVSPPESSAAETSRPPWEVRSARVGVCTVCDEGWRQEVDSDRWTRLDRVGTRHI